MEGMEDAKSDAHLTSAAAFVEGGIQEACDDACSICLEAFCDSDPSTVTNCKHEYHLQCILEWCQRSSQCPMCWQSISLKDPTSQELLEAVEHERSFRFPSRNATIFHHPTLGDFELQHLSVGVNDAELEERIIQHLAAAASMGRRHMARREGQRQRSSAQGRPQFLVFSSHPNSPTASSVSSPTRSGEGQPASNIPAGTLSTTVTTDEVDSPQPTTSSVVQAIQRSAVSPGSDVHQGHSSNTRRLPNQYSTNSEDRAGPSELQTFSESIRSKFNAVSMRYKESISKSTRGWKERLFSRNTTEVNAGIATVSHMMERLETKDNGRNGAASSLSNSVDSDIATGSDQQHAVEAGVGGPSNNIPIIVEAPHATSSSSY